MGTPGINLTKDALKAQVQHVLDNMARAQEDGNWELFAQCFAHNNETVNIGTDLDEYWIGWDAFQQDAKELFELKKGYQVQVKNTRINLSSDGNVAWYAQMMDTCLETKGEPVRIEGFRHTGVMEKTGDRWLVVQSHFSAPDMESIGLDDSGERDFLMQM